jgi:flavin-dependent dehydrogenase
MSGKSFKAIQISGPSKTERTRGENFADIVIIGNGAAAAGAVSSFKELLADRKNGDLFILVLEADTEEQIALEMPEFHSRVTFPRELSLPPIDDITMATYDKVAFYSPRTVVRKNLPSNQVSLVDIRKLIERLEGDLPENMEIRCHKQVYHARYVEIDGEKLVELSVQYPFGDEKVFEITDKIFARAVIDCSGTASIMLDKMQNYRNDSDVVCGVLGFKMIGADIPDVGEVSLGLDDQTTHGAGSWSYPNQTISQALRDYLEKWFSRTSNPRIQDMVKGKTVTDFVGTISDVGISSISTYANVQHYRDNLERQAEDLFHHLGAYEKMFYGAAVIPGSAFYKPSPVLQPVSKMAGDLYILVGDAAGHATPYIGEGIRPGIEMGRAAAEILLDALRDNDLSGDRLCARFENTWWDRYGRYDIWSDLFRHFSSTCFKDKQWDQFMDKVQVLTDDEFYDVLKSEYSFRIVLKMFPVKLAWHYLRYKFRKIAGFLFHRLNLRQATSWVK